MVSRKTVENILTVYENAWVNQDPDKILNIFTKDATYHERVLKEPYVGHEQIRKYWQSKVVEEQSSIKFKLLNFYIEGDVVVAEWDITFFNNRKNKKIHMKEVGIFEIVKNKIKSIREYWQAEELA